MSITKKTLSLLLCGAMALSVTGCGNTAENEKITTPKAEATATTTTTAVADTTTTVTTTTKTPETTTIKTTTTKKPIVTTTTTKVTTTTKKPTTTTKKPTVTTTTKKTTTTTKKPATTTTKKKTTTTTTKKPVTTTKKTTTTTKKVTTTTTTTKPRVDYFPYLPDGTPDLKNVTLEKFPNRDKGEEWHLDLYHYLYKALVRDIGEDVLNQYTNLSLTGTGGPGEPTIIWYHFFAYDKEGNIQFFCIDYKTYKFYIFR